MPGNTLPVHHLITSLPFLPDGYRRIGLHIGTEVQLVIIIAVSDHQQTCVGWKAVV